LIDVFEREIYGRRPANIPKVSWQVVNTSRETNGSVATVTRQLLGRVDNSSYPAISVNIQAILTLPANVRERVPVIIQFGGGAFDLPANVSTSANPCQLPGAGRGVPPPAPPAAAGVPQELTWQQQILSRGWGYVNLNIGACRATAARGSTGIISPSKGQPRKLDDGAPVVGMGREPRTRLSRDRLRPSMRRVRRVRDIHAPAGARTWRRRAVCHRLHQPSGQGDAAPPSQVRRAIIGDPFLLLDGANYLMLGRWMRCRSIRTS
jgi:hypothetical protein